MSRHTAQSDSPGGSGSTGLSFINNLDAQLRAIAELQLATRNRPVTRLRLKLFYSGEPAGRLSFDLNGFSPAEAVALARDIGSHPLIMREIDDCLCADLAE